MSGATGFIGKYLTKSFEKQGHHVVPLTWEAFQDENVLISRVSGSDIVINLAGAPINQRWTKHNKKEIYNSRVITTRKLVRAINASVYTPRLLITTSAVGYYSPEGCHTETDNQKGTGFLADLCEAWEAEARQVNPKTRLIITRFGVVLSGKGGAFPRMLLPTKFRVAAILGSGEQPFPWVEIDDLARIMMFLIYNKEIQGVVNVVAPQIVTNRKFTKLMARYYSSWITVRIPETLLRLVMGKVATTLMQGQRVIPGVLNDERFSFNTPSIEQFFQDIILE